MQVTSCSHSRFEGRETIANFSDASVHSGACTFPLTGFSWKVRPFKGVSSIVAHFGLRSVQRSCSALTTFSVLSMRSLQ